MELLLNEELLPFYNQDLFAKVAVLQLFDLAQNSSIENLFTTKEILQNKYRGNVVVKNALKYFLYQLNQQDIEKSTKEKKEKILNKFVLANKEISWHTFKKIRNNSNVLVHSINNQIYESLLRASKKNILVITFEHSPLGIGEKFVKKLKESKIKTKLFPDSAISSAVAGADICFIGADAVMNKGAIVKQGSILIAQQAKENSVPLYVLSHTWKYDPKAEAELIFKEHENTRHDFKKVYEFLPNNKITAYICEYGIIKPALFKEEIYFYNKWMFI